MNQLVISEKRLKKCQEDTTENKADEPLASLQRDGQSKDDKQKYSRVETLHSLGISVMRSHKTHK